MNETIHVLVQNTNDLDAFGVLLIEDQVASCGKTEISGFDVGTRLSGGRMFG